MTSSSLPACRHRRQQIAADRWECTSNKLVMPGRVATSEFCRSICPCIDHERLDDSAASQASEHRMSPSGNGLLSPCSSVDEVIEATEPSPLRLPRNWQSWENVQLAHRRRFDCQAAITPTYPGGFEGRGIVIGAGGPLYFRCAYIVVSVLRKLGCDLPIEFWHLGPEEIDDAMAQSVEHLNVACCDATNIAPAPRILKGWELKPFSVIHSRFREVLYLDADNIPARNPSYLFDDPRYRELGSIFWPDLPQSILPNQGIPDLTWDVAGIDWRDHPPFETGQFLIDKQKCWRELQLTMHLNEFSDFWYKYVYGDKDTFKLAWHKLHRPYAMPDVESDWKWPAIFQFDLDGQLLFTHACQGKQQLILGESLSALPLSSLVEEAAAEMQHSTHD